MSQSPQDPMQNFVEMNQDLSKYESLQELPAYQGSYILRKFAEAESQTNSWRNAFPLHDRSIDLYLLEVPLTGGVGTSLIKAFVFCSKDNQQWEIPKWTWSQMYKSQQEDGVETTVILLFNDMTQLYIKKLSSLRVIKKENGSIYHEALAMHCSLVKVALKQDTTKNEEDAQAPN